jgi:LacI family transcriptional regulator
MIKGISQKKLADSLGVSQSLVSLVLNGRRSCVAEETYRKIWEAAVEHGYAPRGMRPAFSPEIQHGAVGIVTRAGQKLAAESNTMSHVRQGMYSLLQQSNVSLAYLGGEGELDEKNLLELLGRRDPLLGIVVLGEVSGDFMQALSELKLDLVNVYASQPGACHSIVPHDTESMKQIVDHLVDLGHTHFAWLGGNAHLKRNTVRFEALKEHLAHREIEFDERFAINAPKAGRQDGFDGALELERRAGGRDLPTAWVCHNGLMARGCLQFAYMRGMKIPEEISIAAIDHTRVCVEIHPYLTCAGSAPEIIGEAAARLLLENKKRAGSKSNVLTDMVFPSIFTEGESSAACPA